MSSLKQISARLLPPLRLILVMVWLNNLAHTDALFSIYILIAFFSFYLCIKNKASPEHCRHRLLPIVLCVLFSGAVILANYPIFTQLRDPALIGRSTNLMVNLINTGLSFLGGCAVAHPILSWWFHLDIRPRQEAALCQKHRFLPLAAFLTIAGINLIHLFLVEYPGNLTEDTMTQISEMVSGEYSNFNTFWHTMLFRSILTLGYTIFGNVNAAAALFCVFQILVMSLAFAYCLNTMDRLGTPKGFLLVSFLTFAILPYHMALMISVWKDVLFAGGCLLMLTALIRITKCTEAKPVLHYILFFAGSLLFLLARTNGWIIYLVFFLIYLIFQRSSKKLLALMAALAIFGWFLLNPMLSILHVTGGDMAESLSAPIQQVSRVIAEGCDLSEEDTALLEKVVDLDEVPSLYTDWLSDPMKVELRSKNYDYFLENFDQYRDLWIRLGLKYPWQYIKAWVDQTKGYWNGGYDYAMYTESITDNPYGIEKTSGSNPVASLFRLYFGLSRHVIFFEPLHSIGLHIWVVILCFLRSAARKEKEWLIALPLLLLVVGLWCGTPVYACFRYIYPLFASFPLIVSTTLFTAENTVNQ